MTKKLRLLTSQEAANLLGVSRQGLSYLVKNGKVKPVEIIEIPSQIVSKYKFFSEEKILELRAQR